MSLSGFRPPISIIVPFAGSESQFETVRSALAVIKMAPVDELIVVDNGGRVSKSAHPVRVITATEKRSPGFARNCGAAAATGEWLVFIDADTIPGADLLAQYFAPLPAPNVGVLAGAIIDVADPETWVSRHAVARAQMSQERVLERGEFGYAQTANCAVRRSAFEAIGGFNEGIRAAEDADLCFRLREAGWMLTSRPAASVEHRARADLGGLVRQLLVHGAGAAWLDREYPGALPVGDAGELLHRRLLEVRETFGALARRDRVAAGNAVLEIVSAVVFGLGRLRHNRLR